LIEARILLARQDFAGLRRRVADLALAPGATAHRADAAWLALAAGDAALASHWSPPEPAATGGAESALMPGLYGARWSRCAICSRAFVEQARGDVESATRHRQRIHGWLHGLEKQGGSWHGLHYLRGVLHAQEGNRQSALASLERAVELGWRSGWLLRTDPVWRELRDDPRFARLAGRIDAETRRLREQLDVPAAAVPAS